MADDDLRVYFNPRCSKCRDARGLLEDRGVEAEYVRYLDEAPSRDELERVMGLLGIDDPRAMMRTGEPIYAELDLEAADPDALLDAMTRDKKNRGGRIRFVLPRALGHVELSDEPTEADVRAVLAGEGRMADGRSDD